MRGDRDTVSPTRQSCSADCSRPFGRAAHESNAFELVPPTGPITYHGQMVQSAGAGPCNHASGTMDWLRRVARAIANQSKMVVVDRQSFLEGRWACARRALSVFEL